ncbi:MAG: 3'-5' exonuclease [Spirochaetales bacterium]|nr:3'-5' exonuclease [Spirochaetales bacterium]
MKFSILDVETTGFSPQNGDRVVEIGVIRMDENGHITTAFDSLINPESEEVGPTHVHGITSAMVQNAPLFKDVTGPLLDALDGTIVVAHNASFDMGFLRTEFSRAHITLPKFRPLCTLILARRYLSHLSSKSLESCRSHLGLSNAGAHNALADARATAQVLQYFLENHPEIEFPEAFQSPGQKKVEGEMLFDFAGPILKPRG